MTFSDERDRDYACPRCGDPLVPIYVVEAPGRRALALSCREPYCDHFQRLPEPSRSRAEVLRRTARGDAEDRRSA